MIPSPLRNSTLCFGCGPENEAGLRLEFSMRPDGRLETRFRPREIHGGWQGIFHGGLMATLLDEAMLAHLYLRSVHAATASLEVRYAQEVRLGEEILVEAWESSKRGRLHTMEAVAMRDEKIVARATAKCLVGRERNSRKG